MQLFIELPTWLGDTIMATPAIENICHIFPHSQITLFGSFAALETLKNHPNVKKIVIDESKKSKFRPKALYDITKNLNSFDIAISLRSSFMSKLLLFFIKAKQKFQYNKKIYQGHQAQKYNNFINNAFLQNLPTNSLKLYYQPFIYDKPTLGINPGAAYGSAKRWYPEKFAQVAIALSKKYHIIIFGGPGEVPLANDIEKVFVQNSITNYQNLAGKTSIKELIEKIAGLSLFITGDSGPMHIAAAYQIPTVSIFGPTNHQETHQWKNKQSKIVRHDLPCAPCMQRTCPLKHHECMKLISSDEVISAVDSLQL